MSLETIQQRYQEARKGELIEHWDGEDETVEWKQCISTEIANDMELLLIVAREARQLDRAARVIGSYGYVDMRQVDFDPLREALAALETA